MCLPAPTLSSRASVNKGHGAPQGTVLMEEQWLPFEGGEVSSLESISGWVWLFRMDEEDEENADTCGSVKCGNSFI